MGLADKWEHEKNPIQPVKNEDLTCRTCKNRYKDRTVDCKVYETKPVSVLKGGVCSGYKKE